MRLFLSSENVGNYPEVFAKMVGGGKLALVENAKDYQDQKTRQAKVAQHHKQFKDLGFDVYDLDLRDYFGAKQKLAEKMQEFSGVFVFGGNTFILRRSMAASGFDAAVNNLLAKDKIAYGGSSAGSMVMTPDLKGPDWSEEDGAGIVPEGYDPKPIYEGLGLVDFYIVPHHGSPLHGNSPNKLAEYYKSHKSPHYVLSDGQVVVVDGDKTEVLK